MRGRPIGSKNLTSHKWTSEEKEYLKKITPGHHYKEILKIMNKKYDFDFTIGKIKGAIRRYKLNTGFTGRFNKQHIPANKGITGVWFKGSEVTWFKKGTIPPNHRPVGSERINSDGYSEIKVEETNKWRGKHILVWEKHKGNIPKGYAVIFGDGDKRNLDINNLILVSRQQLLILNKNKLIQNDAELTRTGVIIADLYQVASKRKQSSKI